MSENVKEAIFQYRHKENDEMINIETIMFMKMLEELCELSKGGFVSLSEATSSSHSKVIYDDTRGDEKGYPIALMTLIDDDLDGCHHDIINYYDSYINSDGEYWVRACEYEEGLFEIQVTFQLSDIMIGIEDGEWSIIW